MESKRIKHRWSQFNFRMTESEFCSITRYASTNHINKSEVIRRALNMFFEQNNMAFNEVKPKEDPSQLKAPF